MAENELLDPTERDYNSIYNWFFGPPCGWWFEFLSYFHTQMWGYDSQLWLARACFSGGKKPPPQKKVCSNRMNHIFRAKVGNHQTSFGKNFLCEVSGYFIWGVIVPLCSNHLRRSKKTWDSTGKEKISAFKVRPKNHIKTMPFTKMYFSISFWKTFYIFENVFWCASFFVPHLSNYQFDFCCQLNHGKPRGPPQCHPPQEIRP